MIFAAITFIIVALIEWGIIQSSRWYDLKQIQMEQLSRITVSIDWSGSAFTYAPRSITLQSKDDWQTDAARIIKTALSAMESVDINSVSIVPSPTTPETVGKVVINEIDEYAYTVVTTETTDL